MLHSKEIWFCYNARHFVTPEHGGEKGQKVNQSLDWHKSCLKYPKNPMSFVGYCLILYEKCSIYCQNF